MRQYCGRLAGRRYRSGIAFQEEGWSNQEKSGADARCSVVSGWEHEQWLRLVEGETNFRAVEDEAAYKALESDHEDGLFWMLDRAEEVIITLETYREKALRSLAQIREHSQPAAFS
ncbi:unnamed protein product [Gongylonema pulchrum]|uniref:DUF4288 domain-containing protein n=1 Tax=Gongylonema pulchrum TaxID=637853 RepID=A0A183DI62_9BILA|nr:unnamed protein product [Gongylonema pulchrum]